MKTLLESANWYLREDEDTYAPDSIQAAVEKRQAENRKKFPEKTVEGEKIAKEAGLHYDAWDENMNSYQFSDREITGDTFCAKDVEQAKEKLAIKRKDFDKKKKV